MKVCLKCQNKKALDQFGVDNTKHDGLTYACSQCTSQYKKAYDEARRLKEGRVRRVRAVYEKELNRLEKSAEYYQRNKLTILARHKQYRAKNPEKVHALVNNYKRENPDVIAANVGKRRAAHLKAVPSWANLFYIKEAYSLSALRTKVTGIKYHVDHIIPLVSDVVCGLHVENNLQVIPAVVNLKKGNRFNGA